MLKILIAIVSLLLLGCKQDAIFAQESILAYEKVSDTQIKVTTPIKDKVETISLSDLKWQLENLLDRKARIDAEYDVAIIEVQIKINEANKLGVKETVATDSMTEVVPK